jgi:hypothetical protein
MRLNAALLCLSMAVAYAQSSGNGVTIQVGGMTVGTRGALDLESGNGVLQTCRDDYGGNRIVCTPSYNSALIATHDTIHSNENYCFSSNGTATYTCRMRYKVLTAYETGAGVKNIKKSDGTTDPQGVLIAGQPQWIFYDGSVFRLMGGAGGRGLADDRDRDAIARRFISAMETMTYAPSIALQVTAGDLHKTVTSPAVGNATISAVTGGLPGQHMWIIIANDFVSGKTITFGANLRSSGTLTGTPGKAATIQFVSDGTAWYEVARTMSL